MVLFQSNRPIRPQSEICCVPPAYGLYATTRAISSMPKLVILPVALPVFAAARPAAVYGQIRRHP